MGAGDAYDNDNEEHRKAGKEVLTRTDKLSTELRKVLRADASAEEVLDSDSNDKMVVVMNPLDTHGVQYRVKHGGVRSVAVRVPAHVVARALAASFGAPITATSANRSGAVPAAVAGALGAVADDPQVLVIDSGPTPGGEPSTISIARTPAVPGSPAGRIFDRSSGIV